MLIGLRMHDQFRNKLEVKTSNFKIHSVFRNVINLLDDDSHIISIVTKNVDRSPYSVIVDADDFSSYIDCIGDTVDAMTNKIYINETTIDLSTTNIYELQRGKFKKNTDTIRKNLFYLDEIIVGIKDTEKSCFANIANALIMERIELMKYAYFEGNTDNIIKWGRSLIGLGQGLTPSGDDVLMGIYLVLGLENSKIPQSDRVLGEIIHGMIGATTDISYQGLLRSSQGYYRGILVDTVESICTDKNISKALNEVLSIGHSSGYDLILGMRTGFEILIEKETKNVNKDFNKEKYLF